MVFAHLPAGYLVARAVMGRTGPLPGLLLAGMAGGVFPDVDLLYGALFDDGWVNHHRYWTHKPFFWLLVWLAGELAGRALPGRARGFLPQARVFLLAVLGHLVLDTNTGIIWWTWPWLDRPYTLAGIPDIYDAPLLNHLFHWTFALEMAIVALAGWVEWDRRRWVGRFA